ncbi:hypothetical protein Hdeb2414_s0007g00260131 [Helianthus debilis subsp. tardiflorus]
MYDILSELTRIYSFLLILTVLTHPISATTATSHELRKGFTATPDSSVTSFQPLLSDSVGNYSLGFLRVDKSQLALVVIHNPSKEQVWAAGKGLLSRWSSQTRLSFNGSLVITDARTGALWSRVFLYKRKSRGVKGYVEEDGGGVGPYKNLGSASFKSVELSVR